MSSASTESIQSSDNNKSSRQPRNKRNNRRPKSNKKDESNDKKNETDFVKKLNKKNGKSRHGGPRRKRNENSSTNGSVKEYI